MFCVGSFLSSQNSYQNRRNSVSIEENQYKHCRSIYVYIERECFVTTDSSARKSEVPPIVSASDRDPLAFDLGPSTFVSRELSMPISPPGLRRAHPRAHALGITRRRRARRPRTGRILRRCLAAGEDLCGAVALRRCFGPTRCRRNIYLWCLKYLSCLLLLTRVGLRYEYERE